jgi:hypothetical protein
MQLVLLQKRTRSFSFDVPNQVASDKNTPTPNQPLAKFQQNNAQVLPQISEESNRDKRTNTTRTRENNMRGFIVENQGTIHEVKGAKAYFFAHLRDSNLAEYPDTRAGVLQAAKDCLVNLVSGDDPVDVSFNVENDRLEIEE